MARLDGFDKESDDEGRGVELAAFVALGAVEFDEEIFAGEACVLCSFLSRHEHGSNYVPMRRA